MVPVVSGISLENLTSGDSSSMGPYSQRCPRLLDYMEYSWCLTCLVRVCSIVAFFGRGASPFSMAAARLLARIDRGVGIGFLLRATG